MYSREPRRRTHVHAHVHVSCFCRLPFKDARRACESPRNIIQTSNTQLVTNSMLSYSVTAHRYIATVGVLDALSSLSSLLGSTTYLIPFQLHRSTCSAPADCRELPPALFCSFARHRKAPSRRRCLRDGVAMRPKIKWTRLHEGCSENRRGTAKRDRKRQTPKG